jgi:hypothetical protein
MAQLNNVTPGQLIKAVDWNALVAAVQALSGQVQAGGVTVPDLFGWTLGTAVAVINLPSTQLKLGSILDTFGDTVDPRLPESIALLVLGQSPPVSTNVPAGSSLNLVVSAKVGSPPGGSPVTLGITGVQPGQGQYTANNDTISLFSSQGPPYVIILQATVPSGADTYTTDDPTFDSGGWSGAVIQGKHFGTPGVAGQPVQLKVAVTAVGAKTTLHLGVRSDQHANVFARISPTIQVS